MAERGDLAYANGAEPMSAVSSHSVGLKPERDLLFCLYFLCVSL